MRALEFSHSEDIHVLCLGAHSDDIEIGCGGTILRFASQFPHMRCTWVVFSAQELRAAEAQLSAQLFLQHAKQHHIELLSFKDGFFPWQGAEIKATFEALKQTMPDVIFTHYRNDLHQDHRVISDLTWNTFRNHLIFEYEIPKYDGDLGSPNCFVTLDKQVCQTKTKLLLECFASQRTKPWFTDDTFMALLRLRGVEAASPTQYAEAFYTRKMIL